MLRRASALSRSLLGSVNARASLVAAAAVQERLYAHLDGTTSYIVRGRHFSSARAMMSDNNNNRTQAGGSAAASAPGSSGAAAAQPRELQRFLRSELPVQPRDIPQTPGHPLIDPQETNAKDHAATVYEALRIAGVEGLSDEMPAPETLQEPPSPRPVDAHIHRSESDGTDEGSDRVITPKGSDYFAIAGEEEREARERERENEAMETATPGGEATPGGMEVERILTPRGGDYYEERGHEPPELTGEPGPIEVMPIAAASSTGGGGTSLPPPGAALAMQLLKRTSAGSRTRSASRPKRRPRVRRPLGPADGTKKRFGIIFCEDEENWVEELPAVWIKLLRQPGEEWIVYRAAEKGEIPALEDNLDGVLIPGSRYSAYEKHDWILRLKEYIRACFIPWLADHNAPEHYMKPQIVGSCFGCQVIAEALGGHVAKNPRGKYIVKAEEIYPTEAFVRQPFADGLLLKTRRGIRFQPKREKWTTHDDLDSEPFMRITQTHGDSVITLPVDSQVLAWSKTVTNEIFLTGKNMLSYQSHPEFTVRKHIMERIIPYVFPETMDADMFETAKKSFDQPLHSHALIEITRRFLKREYRDTYAMYHTGLAAMDEQNNYAEASPPRAPGVETPSAAAEKLQAQQPRPPSATQGMTDPQAASGTKAPTPVSNQPEHQ